MTRLLLGPRNFKWWKVLMMKVFPLNRNCICFGQTKASSFRTWVSFSDTFAIETIVLALSRNVVNPNLHGHGKLGKDSGTLGTFK